MKDCLCGEVGGEPLARTVTCYGDGNQAETIRHPSMEVRQTVRLAEFTGEALGGRDGTTYVAGAWP